MITVVGSKDKQFNYIDACRKPFYCESDPNNFYYNEYCGHLYNLAHIEEMGEDGFIGLEHYRRTFAKDGMPLDGDKIRSILKDNDIIVKEKHGPYGKHTNLSVLSGCSRHHINYMNEAVYALNMFPELNKQAYDNTHYGCNMFITTPDKYKLMMEDAKHYIDKLLTFSKQQSMISYFAETILTPYLITKYNKNIYIGEVIYESPIVNNG